MMMVCDTGRLQEYLDDVLPPEERQVVEAHLAECAACREELVLIQQRSGQVALALAELGPHPHEALDPTQALFRFRTLMQPDQPSRWIRLRRRFDTMTRTLLTPRRRPAIAGLLTLLIVVSLIGFAPAREAMAQFLGIFRVRRFAVIPLDPALTERLQSLGDLVESDMLGEPTVLREPGEPRNVSDAAEASALAGFSVRMPTALPESAVLTTFRTESGPAMRLDMERARLQFFLDAADVQGVTLPSVDTITTEIDVPTLVEQEYSIGSDVSLAVMQVPSPTVTMPAGIDPALLGEALLQLLGVPAEDAHRLAQTIDWTSTLVIPLPTDMAQFREVTVDGVVGVLLEKNPYAETDSFEPGGMVLWQRDGIVYAVAGENMEPAELVRVANSLR